MQISPRDFFLMPVFDKNWPALVIVIVVSLLSKRLFFKNYKVSVVYSIVVIFYSAVATLPLQSLAALKLWRLSDDVVLYVIFPLCALVTTPPVSYLLIKIHMRVHTWWKKRKKRITDT